ncbi:hypothetical protein HPB48_014959 [Haemaphysalis longicornis]|uniref:Ig-like domain-containing protein n=1 Tax=Haemaphysalis longicornis TaxID=44386 RepID=A0A9J6FJE7_HAELO|nr:hypothetical protein HPB48_014959 [Haemaphysalis longicornis]
MSLSLSLADKPQVSLAWGNRVNRSSIVQGTDVYFECEVDANPRLVEVSWRFEGHELASRLTNFIVSNQSLALRGVQGDNSGHYSCVAANAEGTAESNRVFLKVQREYNDLRFYLTVKIKHRRCE